MIRLPLPLPWPAAEPLSFGTGGSAISGKVGEMMARMAQGLTREAATGPATGLCIVRVERQGPTGFLVTVTCTADVTRRAPARVTTRRTVEVEVAVDEVRSFLNEFRHSV